MALVPWTYNNPRVDIRSFKDLCFTFAGKRVVLSQRLGTNVSLEQNTNFKLWDGAFLLGKYLENQTVFPGGFWGNKRCLELGSGCGLVGIVAWLLGADVTLTDLPEAVAHTETCLALNNIERTNSSIRVQEYSWADELPDTDYFKSLDYIFGSDVVYQPRLCKKLVTSLSYLMGPKTIALISYKERGLGEEVFFRLLTLNNFQFEKINSNCHPKEFLNSDYNLFSIKKL